MFLVSVDRSEMISKCKWRSFESVTKTTEQFLQLQIEPFRIENIKNWHVACVSESYLA